MVLQIKKHKGKSGPRQLRKGKAMKKFQDTEAIGTITEQQIHECWDKSFKIPPLGKINFSNLTLCVTSENKIHKVVGRRVHGLVLHQYGSDGMPDADTEYTIDNDPYRLIEVRI